MSRTNYITRLVILISLTLIIELIGLPQPFTGPLVNMMLFLTTILLNPGAGVILGIITPLAAAIRGQLPPFLIPMVPFIIISNAILVVIFGYVCNLLKCSGPARKNPLKSVKHWVGLIAGSFFKFVWLYLSAKIILPVLLGKQLPPQFIAMMAMPQFITALIGGVLALIIGSMLLRILYASQKN